MNKIFKSEKILQAVLNYYGITNQEIISNSKNVVFVEARKMFCYISTEFSNAKYEDIGKLINRDHSTVTYSVNKIKVYKEVYSKIRKDIEQVTVNLFSDHSLIPDNIDLLRMTENYTNSFI